ncbi:MAG: hypothetical protein WC260_03390 [Candidatus Pacearchaeota archaeon]
MEDSLKKIRIYMLIITICLIALLLPIVISALKKPSTAPENPNSLATTPTTEKNSPPPPRTTEHVSPRLHQGVIWESVKSAQVRNILSANTVEISLRLQEDDDPETRPARIIGLKDTDSNTHEGLMQTIRLRESLLHARISYTEGWPAPGETERPIYIFFPVSDLFVDWFIYMGMGYFESDGYNTLYDEVLSQSERYAIQDGNGLHAKKGVNP